MQSRVSSKVFDRLKNSIAKKEKEALAYRKGVKLIPEHLTDILPKPKSPEQPRVRVEAAKEAQKNSVVNLHLNEIKTENPSNMHSTQNLQSNLSLHTDALTISHYPLPVLVGSKLIKIEKKAHKEQNQT